MKTLCSTALLLLASALAGCASAPPDPSVRVRAIAERARVADGLYMTIRYRDGERSGEFPKAWLLDVESSGLPEEVIIGTRMECVEATPSSLSVPFVLDLRRVERFELWAGGSRPVASWAVEPAKPRRRVS